jgi:DNA-binding NarL/FixJ family response regulator
MLVDDHTGVAKALTRLLSFDCDVVAVIGDGGEAVEAGARLQPVVMLLDLHLPTVNGLDVCRQVTSSHPQVKVIVISAVTDATIADEARAAGASDFVPKSAGHELLDAIRRIWTELG